MKKSCLSLMVLLIILLVAGPLSAQSGSVKGKESWNRAVEAVSVMPSADRETQESVATVFLSLDANNVTEPMDLSTDVSLLVDGKVVGQQRLDITALPAVGFGCNCSPWEMCLIVDGIQMGCVDGWLACDPIPLGRDPGDLIEVRLSSSAGAIDDLEHGDDFGRLVYSGRPELAVVSNSCEGVESGLQTLENSCTVR